uniref:Uncharacterized protein n=1 Tax=Rhizophora mucronata TaxID=61149 RepID=A0A2P2PF16_RHIMU
MAHNPVSGNIKKPRF